MPGFVFKGKEFVYVEELELVIDHKTTVECDLVLMPDWKTRLPDFMKT